MVILKLKNKFDCYKNPHVLNDVSVDNILISKKISSAQKKKKKKKIFIGYANEYKIKPFNIILSKANTYVKSYDGGVSKWIDFLIEDEESLKNSDIWNNISNSMKKNLIVNPSTIIPWRVYRFYD